MGWRATVDDATTGEAQAVVADIYEDGMFPEEVRAQDGLCNMSNAERVPGGETRETEMKRLSPERVYVRAIGSTKTLAGTWSRAGADRRKER